MVRSRRAQLAVALVAVALGFLVVVQYRSQGGGQQLANLSAQDLTTLVGNLDARNAQLRAQAAQLEQELTELRRGETRGASAASQITEDTARVRAWSGLDAVAGPGVLIRVSGTISGQGVQDVVNELWSAGAEAQAVDDVRLVAGSVIAGEAGAISVENQPLMTPFELRAIGRAETLSGTLTRIGGVMAQLAVTDPEAAITITPVEQLLVPATTRSLAPRLATPTF
jgi:uncharacterized protein YlxW (UPF0749 family)